MNKPLVSVIIPCYNQSRYLQEAVNSVLESNYENMEIIIINDGSTDEKSIEFLKTFSALKTEVIHQENQGVSVARNNAINYSNGKYILPLDADDKIHSEFIEKAVEVLENNENIGIVGGVTEFFGKKQGLFEIPKYKFPDILKDNLLVCTCMYRKDDWQKIGGYNPNMIYGLEDWDFWLSIIELEREVFQFDSIIFYYRQQEASRTTGLKNNKKLRMVMQIIQNHMDLYAKHPEELKFLFETVFETFDWFNRKIVKIKKQRNLYLSAFIITIFVAIILLLSLILNWKHLI